MILYRTPGRSFTRPPRTSTIECSCRLWPMPGIYVVTSTALVKRTRATFRSAEFGFFGVCVYTRMQTPRFSGQPINAGDLVLLRIPSLPMRTSCANVGTVVPLFEFFGISYKSNQNLELMTPSIRAQTHFANSCVAREQTHKSTQ